VFKKLRARLDEQLALWKQMMATDVPALNDAVKRLDEQATELRLVTMRLFAAVNALRAPLRYLGR